MNDRTLITRGILFRITDYRETSLIVEAFCEHVGLIAILIKGAKREKRADQGFYQRFFLLEFTLHHQPNSELYLLKAASYLEDLSCQAVYENFMLQSAALELYSQLICLPEETEAYFELLLQFLNYIRQVPQNGILVFWRFLLGALRIMGIPLHTELCIHCHKDDVPYTHYSILHGGFLCQDCAFDLQEAAIPVEADTAQLIRLLPQIGKHLKDLHTDPSLLSEIQNIFNLHLEHHMHRKIHFRSLQGLIRPLELKT